MMWLNNYSKLSDGQRRYGNQQLADQPRSGRLSKIVGIVRNLIQTRKINQEMQQSIKKALTLM